MPSEMARARVLTYTMLLQTSKLRTGRVAFYLLYNGSDSKLEWMQCYESAHHAESFIVGCLILLFDKHVIMNTILGVRRAVCSTFRKG